MSLSCLGAAQVTELSSQVDRNRSRLGVSPELETWIGFVMRWVNKVTGVCRGTGSIHPLSIQSFIEEIH